MRYIYIKKKAKSNYSKLKEEGNQSSKQYESIGAEEIWTYPNKRTAEQLNHMLTLPRSAYTAL